MQDFLDQNRPQSTAQQAGTSEEVGRLPPLWQLQQIVRDRGGVLGRWRLRGCPGGGGDGAGRLGPACRSLVARCAQVCWGGGIAGPQSFVSVFTGGPVDQTLEGRRHGRAQPLWSQAGKNTEAHV